MWDAKLLADPKVAKFLKDEGVIMTDWREMMRRFQGGPPAKEPKEKAPEKSKPEPAPKTGEPQAKRRP